MKIYQKIRFLLLPVLVLLAGCVSDSSDDIQEIHEVVRMDGAYKLNISDAGSLQNPAWSPDDRYIILTRFINGYNEDSADLVIFDLSNGVSRLLVSDGSGNINLPGSCWNPITHSIVFSSTREPHDEIFVIAENGNPGDEVRITEREGKVAYEPSFSPDGQWIVFESHRLDVEENGVIYKYRIDGTEPYKMLTDLGNDCRQPNWSPSGEHILYQQFSERRWDIWLMNADGSNKRMLTSGEGDKTDASFSPDGGWIVYSSDEDEIQFANLFIIPIAGGKSIRVTDYDGYDGAPSWSSSGRSIAFESYPGDPDDSSGTTLWAIDVPEH